MRESSNFAPKTFALFFLGIFLRATLLNKHLWNTVSKVSEVIRLTQLVININPEIMIKNTRESVLGEVIKQLPNNYSIFEFGVAHGHLTRYLFSIENYNKNYKIISYHGFDTFEGLPQTWREHGVGAFSNQGKTPTISDTRINWHVGLIDSNFDIDFLLNQKIENCLYIFDLDLLEPTKNALEAIYSHLKECDVVYFDEAFVRDEFYLIENFLLEKCVVEVIASSWTSVAFKFLSFK